MCFLRLEKQLSISATKGYHLTLSAVFKSCLQELVWRDLIQSFDMQRPQHPVHPPSWDLVKVLTYLCGPVFEPLRRKSLRIVKMTVAFLLALATAKHVGGLQALSGRMKFLGPEISVSYLPEFVAKTESKRNPLSRSFLV